jgi:hypothetical protein|tara:strand:- start:7 stop:615 length:609 start_codon:yes stop_codon:yes gene_type:complete
MDSMDALKIVSQHYDTEIIDKVKLTNDHINKFDEKRRFILKELDNILWVTRVPSYSEEKFYEMYNNYTHISDDDKKKIWDNCKNTREKYKELFDLFGDDKSNHTMFSGLVGGIRAISQLYYDCDLVELEEDWDHEWEAGNDYDPEDDGWETADEDEEDDDDDDDNDDVEIKKVSREKLINRRDQSIQQLTDEIFTLDLNLDT